MILYYRNSFLASLVSIVGSLIGLGGIGMLFSGLIPTGIVLIAVAAVLLYAAKQISSKKSFEKWWKQIRDIGLEPEISQSLETAVAVYRKNPEKRTLEKIRSLNPQAADYIENGFREPAIKPQASPVVHTQPVSPAQPRNSTEETRFCTNCGQQLSPGSKFCSNCGTGVSGQASAPAVHRQPESMEQVTKSGSRKLIFPAIAVVILLVALVASMFRNTGADAPEQAQTVSPPPAVTAVNEIPINHDIQIKFEHEYGYTFPIVFAQPLMRCSEFTLNYEIMLLGQPEPEETVLCDVYIRLLSEEWVRVAAFRMDGTKASNRIYLNQPMDFDSVAVVYHGEPFPYDIAVFDPA